MPRRIARLSIIRWLDLVPIAAAFMLLQLMIGMPNAGAEPLKIGSKRFTESYLLGEIIVGTARRAGVADAEHRPGLGNSAILFAALKSGAIDLYPDYSGTVALELLGLKQVPSLPELNRLLSAHGLAAGVQLGFDNAYALAMTAEKADRLGYGLISDLRSLGDLRAGLSPEFLSRRDGWPSLRAVYGLDGLQIRGLDHGLAYEALARGQVDLIDVYTTDPQIARQGLKLLRDDRKVFPAYEALLVYRMDLPQRHPVAWAALQGLQGRLDAETMRKLNAAVELDGRSFAAVAGQWMDGASDPIVERQILLAVLLGPDLFRLTAQHLILVCSSLMLSIFVGIPLGIWSQRAPRAGRWILPFIGVLQTVPSLALLAFLIAALGQIGALPAVLALFLYALLPIVRGTESALAGVGREMLDAGRALGLDAWQRLRLIEMPLALPGVLAGIKTAAVINVGTATIAAFIGAGGYGERIVAGLAVNDRDLMLAGAIPAAVLALLFELLFRGLDRQLWGRRDDSGASS
jgi:osmoprotectant transport system permease protein